MTLSATETAAKWGRRTTMLVWVALIASGVVFAFAVSAPMWFGALDHNETFRWLADVVVDFLQNFYHEPEMDIV